MIHRDDDDPVVELVVIYLPLSNIYFPKKYPLSNSFQLHPIENHLYRSVTLFLARFRLLAPTQHDRAQISDWDSNRKVDRLQKLGDEYVPDWHTKCEIKCAADLLASD